MVSADVKRASGAIQGSLEDRDLMSLAVIGLSISGGLFAAQEVTDFVLPQLGMSRDPSSPTGLGASAAVKTVGAGATAMASSQFGGKTATAILGLMAGGMLASAGLDAFDMAQRGGIPGAAVAQNAVESATPSNSTPSPTNGNNGTVRRVSSGNSGTALRTR